MHQQGQYTEAEGGFQKIVRRRRGDEEGSQIKGRHGKRPQGKNEEDITVKKLGTAAGTAAGTVVRSLGDLREAMATPAVTPPTAVAPVATAPAIVTAPALAQAPTPTPTPAPAPAPVPTPAPAPVASPVRVAPLYCMLCGRLRKKATDLVCGDCYRAYANEAAVALAKGRRIFLWDWVLAQAPAVLAQAKEEHAAAIVAYHDLQKKTHDQALGEVKASAGGKMDKTIFNNAVYLRGQELFRAEHGNALYAKMRGLEGKVALLQEFLTKATTPAVPAPAPEPTPEVAPAKKTTRARKPSKKEENSK